MRRQVAGEGQAQAEVAGVVVAAGLLAVKELGELAAAFLGDLVHLAAPATQARARAPGPQGGALPAQRSRHGDRGGQGPPQVLGGSHRAGPFQAGQGRIQRSERHVGELAQLVAQPLADLIAVHGLALEQAEDGELQHHTTTLIGGAQRLVGTVDRVEFIVRCIVSIHRHRFKSPASWHEGWVESLQDGKRDRAISCSPRISHGGLWMPIDNGDRAQSVSAQADPPSHLAHLGPLQAGRTLGHG